MSEMALFVGGPWSGQFVEVKPGGGRITVPAEDSGFAIPRQGIVSQPAEVTYKSGAYFLGPDTARKIYVEENMDEESVEEFMSYFVADLWDECAELNV